MGVVITEIVANCSVMGSEGFSALGLSRAVCLYIVGALKAACFSETFKFIYYIDLL